MHCNNKSISVHRLCFASAWITTMDWSITVRWIKDIIVSQFDSKSQIQYVDLGKKPCLYQWAGSPLPWRLKCSLHIQVSVVTSAFVSFQGVCHSHNKNLYLSSILFTSLNPLLSTTKMPFALFSRRSFSDLLNSHTVMLPRSKNSD